MGADEATLVSAGSSIQNVISSFTAGNLFLNVIFAVSLKYLWKMLDSLQLILFLPMLSVAFPANSKQFFELVLGLLNLKLFDSDYVLKKMGLEEFAVGVSETADYGMQREKNMLQNMGVFFLIIMVSGLVGTVIVLAGKLLWQYPFVKKLAKQIYDAVVFNALLRSFVQAYIVFSTSTLLNCANPNTKTRSDTFSTILAFFSAMFIIGLPFFAAKYLLSHQKDLLLP